jgi:hypothetical protein
MMLRAIACSLLLVISFTKVNSQNRFIDDLKLQVNAHGGYILPEYPFLNALTKDYIRSLDVSLIKETRGKTYWEQIYKYPEYGISFFYSTLGNNEILGHEYALTYFFKLNYIAKKRFKFYQRVGIGGGYITKRFDLDENYMNVAVGSKLNVHFNTRLGTEFKLSEKLNFNLGISFDHFSNANTSEPNLGINYVTGFTGLSYRIGNSTEIKSFSLEKFDKPKRLDLYISLGGKHPRSLSANYFLASSIALEYNKAITRVVKLGVGTDFFYDSSVKSQLKDFNRNYKSHYSVQTGIHFSQSFTYNRFSIELQEGIYLGLTEKVDHYPIYNRGIVRFQLSDKYAIRIAMKSHLYILDYPEFGLGIKL